MEGTEELNNEIIGWKKENDSDIFSRLDQLEVQHSKNSANPVPLRKALRSRAFESDDGLINRIRYSFPRSAVFLHKGVSRSHPISNPRMAKEWFNPVVDKNIDKLGDIVANGQGNLIINNIDIH